MNANRGRGGEGGGSLAYHWSLTPLIKTQKMVNIINISPQFTPNKAGHLEQCRARGQGSLLPTQQVTNESRDCYGEVDIVGR